MDLLVAEKGKLKLTVLWDVFMHMPYFLEAGSKSGCHSLPLLILPYHNDHTENLHRIVKIISAKFATFMVSERVRQGDHIG